MYGTYVQYFWIVIVGEEEVIALISSSHCFLCAIWLIGVQIAIWAGKAPNRAKVKTFECLCIDNNIYTIKFVTKFVWRQCMSRDTSTTTCMAKCKNKAPRQWTVPNERRVEWPYTNGYLRHCTLKKKLSVFAIFLSTESLNSGDLMAENFLFRVVFYFHRPSKWPNWIEMWR